MKKLFTLLLTLFSLTALADNPQEQYCDKVQYGWLYQNNLYTAPYGLGWQFPKPPTGTWEYYSNGYAGANNYKLQCNLPLDDWMPAVLLITACFGIVYFRRTTPHEEI